MKIDRVICDRCEKDMTDIDQYDTISFDDFKIQIDTGNDDLCIECLIDILAYGDIVGWV